MLAVEGVSRRHATLSLGEGPPRLLDAGSKNLLIVGGERRRKVQLVPGLVVQVGKALVSLEETSTSDAELALAFDASSSVTLLGEDRPTDTLDGKSRGRSPATALRFVRRYQGRELEGEARRRFLADSRALLGAGSLLRFRTRRGGDSLVIHDEAGPLPSEEVCAELAALEAADRPRSARVGESRSCVWLTRGTCATAALFDGPVSEAEGWVGDFLGYLAERLGEDCDPRRSADEAGPPDDALDPPPGMVLGESSAMTELLDEVRASLGSRRDVLLEGETGTGKELFARLLHRSGPTSGGPFLAINCAAIPGDLLEAELFGVGRRVATGVDPRPGLFELAEGGTLLLDEIADLPLELQAKLLRVLEEREILPLGAPRVKKIDVRVISTCNCVLRRRVEDGAFRADLFYRLLRLHFRIPPLSERIEDIPALTRVFARRAAVEAGRKPRGISRRALKLLEEHGWPGNVRELQAVVERAVLRCRRGEELASRHFPDLAGREPAVSVQRPSAESVSSLDEASPPLLQDRLDDEERRAIREALAAAGGVRAKAARRLGISRQGLVLKLKRLGLDP